MILQAFFRRRAKLDVAATMHNNGINKNLLLIDERLRKIESRQKETSLQLEEIDNFLNDNDVEAALLNSVIELCDTIEDFYHFSAENINSAFFEQACMMWGKAKNTAESVGLEIIESSGGIFDFRLCSAEGVEYDNGLPNGYVLKTLKCGYIYKDKIIRRACVIVNKINITDGDDTV